MNNKMEFELNENIESAIPMEEPARQEYYMDKCHELVEDFIIRNGRVPSFHVATFGCQMNAHDSERLPACLK